MTSFGTHVVCTKICDFPEQGCNSVCYLAMDMALGVQVAVKDIPESNLNPTNLQEYFSEARIAALAAHPRVIQVLYAGFDPENEFARIVTKHLEGGSLQKRINDALNGQNMLLSSRYICETCLNIAQGLTHLHALNITHLDIKPSNILLEANGEPVIADFGQSRLLKNSIEPAPRMYAKNLAPEVFGSGVVSKLTDIYQFGLLIYRMCNPHGFDAQFATVSVDIPSLSTAVLSGTFPDRGSYPIHVPKKMIDICNKCLCVAPQDRYSNFYDIQNDIASTEALPLPFSLSSNSLAGVHNGKQVTITLQSNSGRYDIATQINGRRKSSLCFSGLSEHSCRAKVKVLARSI